jgi:hypothetical protein
MRARRALAALLGTACALGALAAPPTGGTGLAGAAGFAGANPAAASPAAEGPAIAAVTSTVSLHAALTPEHLGGGTTIHFGFTIAAPAGRLPLPVRQIDLLYPANIGITTSGLGLSTCRARALEAHGPPGCPVNSVMGFGSALVAVPFGPELLEETARTTTFMAPVHNQRLSLLFYVDGENPVYAQLVFPGLVLPAPAPFGGDVNTSLPLIPSVPEASDVALVRLTTTLGPSHVTYVEYKRGHRIPYHPQGFLLPDRCPRGGFRFAARFLFEDGSRTSAATAVPCPRGRR